MYEYMTSPHHIGTITIKNRVVMTAASCSLSEEDGTMTEHMIAYYETRAKAGVGLIITEMVSVQNQHARLFPKQLFASEDRHIADFKALADRLHPYGTKVFAQLFHPGPNASAALNPDGILAPSDWKGKAKKASKGQIESIIKAFGDAALRVKLSGMDGIEIHAGHHYLIHRFLSPAFNQRTDEYGGNLENRTRLLRRIIEEVRKTCGNAFPIMVRVSAEEYIGQTGYHADVGIKICQMLETWGVDAINVTASGTASKLSQSMEPMPYEQGWRRHLLKAVKRSVSIPVCGVSIIREPQFAEELLREGDTDFVGSVRAFLADPEWYEKAVTGRQREINRCISCMSCLERYTSLGHISCAIHPETGYEAKKPVLAQDGNSKLVIVLGAGPAGLYTAYLAAKRGFQVMLYEKTKRMGGQLHLAGVSKRKEKIHWLIESLTQRVESSDVEVLYGIKPTIDELQAKSPYAIIDATGAKPYVPHIEGIELAYTAEDVLRGEVTLDRKSIVVIGSGMTGLEVAEMLSERGTGNAVLILEREGKIAPKMGGSNRNIMMATLEVNQVMVITNRTLCKMEPDRVHFCDTQTGETYVYPCDAVVLAMGVLPSNPYGDTLQGICDRVLQVGDADAGGNIWKAMHDADDAVRRL